ELRRGSLLTEPVALEEIVEKVVARQPEPQLHRVVVTRLEPVSVRGDPERLEQVLTTLVDNAVRYSPDGGDVEVDGGGVDCRAIVTVTDHGIGIPIDAQPHIFERFYRAHTDTPSDRGGMGVSLCLARLLMRQMGGDLWFESEPGAGSRFHVGIAIHGSDD